MWTVSLETFGKQLNSFIRWCAISSIAAFMSGMYLIISPRGPAPDWPIGPYVLAALAVTAVISGLGTFWQMLQLAASFGELVEEAGSFENREELAEEDDEDVPRSGIW